LILRFAVCGKRTETALVKLLPINSAMEVSACADGFGKDDTGGVESLPDLVEVAASGNLLNEYWRETLASELLVDGEEIDLRAGDNVLADT
jgi:hypothetical protein